MKIEEAIRVAGFMLSKKVSPTSIAKSLVMEGFKRDKAETIIRWAGQRNKANQIITQEEFERLLNTPRSDQKNDSEPEPPSVA